MTALATVTPAVPALIDPLDEAARDFPDNARSPRTLKAYEAAFADFRRWAEPRDEATLPASPQTVARYVADLAVRAKPAIEQHLAAIAVYHETAGHESPTANAVVLAVVKDFRRA